MAPGQRDTASFRRNTASFQLNAMGLWKGVARRAGWVSIIVSGTRRSAPRGEPASIELDVLLRGQPEILVIEAGPECGKAGAVHFRRGRAERDFSSDRFEEDFEVARV